MAERVRLWREDYPHFVADPRSMVEKLAPLKPLIGGEELGRWRQLAASNSNETDALFQRVMEAHYDPCYARSTRRHYGPPAPRREIQLRGLDAGSLQGAVSSLISGSAA